MSISETPSTINFSLQRRPTTVTEDLHLNIVPSATEKITSHRNEEQKKKEPLKDIKEGQVVSMKSKFDTNRTDSGSATSQKSTSSKASYSKPQKTIAELTQELKENLNITINEIEKSDVEFERLVGNLEKKIESLRIKLGSSKLE